MTSPITERIQDDVTENLVMLYMKGTAMFPQCGFSARVVQILTHLGVPFHAANVSPKTRNCARASNITPTGRPSRSFT